MNLDRLPPQDIEAEKATLGAILLENSAMNITVEILDENDFYRESHKTIYKTMSELHKRQEAIDLITVVNALRKDSNLEKVDGIAYITSLLNTVSTAANIKYHAEIVRDKSILRQLIKTSTDIAQQAYEGTLEVGEQLDLAEKNNAKLITTEKDWVRLPIEIRDKIKYARLDTVIENTFYDWLKEKIDYANFKKTS